MKRNWRNLEFEIKKPVLLMLDEGNDLFFIWLFWMKNFESGSHSYMLIDVMWALLLPLWQVLAESDRVHTLKRSSCSAMIVLLWHLQSDRFKWRFYRYDDRLSLISWSSWSSGANVRLMKWVFRKTLFKVHKMIIYNQSYFFVEC